MRTPIAGITLATVLALAGPAVAADTWVLWAQTGRRPQPAATFDDKDTCVTASFTEAQAYIVRSRPQPQFTLDLVSIDAGTAVRGVISGKSPIDFPSPQPTGAGRSA